MSEPEENSADEAPIAATLIDASGVRRGSPFAFGSTFTPAAPNQPTLPDTELSPELASFEEFHGVTSATANGSIWAAYLLLPFSIFAATLFPLGGVMIAVLGGGLGIFGMAAKRPLRAALPLLLHIACFCFAYWRFI